MVNIVKKAYNKWKGLPVSVRTAISALTAFTMNASTAIIDLVLGIVFNNHWLLALAAVYTSLGVTRAGILLHMRKTLLDKTLTEEQKSVNNLHTYCYAGVFLFVVAAALIITIVFLALGDRPFERFGFMIYYFAFYTTYKMISSGIHAGKARKMDDFSVKAVRNLSLADGVVSVLALQTALLARFSAGADIAWANAVTGGLVCAFTLYLGVYMMINSHFAYKKQLLSAQSPKPAGQTEPQEGQAEGLPAESPDGGQNT